MRKGVFGGVAALAVLASSAQALEITDPKAAQIEGIVTLPIKGVKAVQSNGQIRFLSENGRFVITGQIYDLWYQKPLDTLTEMQDVALRIDLKQMGLDVDALNTVSLGQGTKEVVVFLDPRCSHCHALINDAKALATEYTFKLIAIPALGAESNRLAKAMSCAKDPQQALNALMDDTLSTLPIQDPCDPKKYEQTLLIAQLLGIEGVPFAISPDGRVSRGRPTNLEAWLEGGR